MSIRSIIKKSDDGVVGIVTAVLIIGLLVSFLALVQVAYVPQWMEQREAEHMHQVESQFAQLKLSLDTQAYVGNKNIPIANSITLGSSEMPFFMTMKAFGNLQILEDVSIINVSNASHYNKTNIGIIKYSSANAYFINQEFIYESGALITNQNDGSSISIKPSFYIESSPYYYNITFTIIDISGVGGKISGGGYDTTSIQTQLAEVYNETIENPRYINITSSFHQSWNESINLTLKKEFPNGYKNDYFINTTGNKVSIDFSRNPPDYIELRIFEIDAQIGPGWVEE